MASLRQLRGRIKSTQNSKQIMRAMQLVSASKLKRAQSRLLQAREVLAFLDGLLQRVLAATSQRWENHPLCEKRQEGDSALVLFTSDAGLCGAYNTNLIQLAEAHLQRDSLRRTHVIYIGKKGYRYFVKRGYAASEAYLELAGRPNLATTQEIGRSLMGRFLSHRVTSVELLYSRFVSSSVYQPTIRQWLPIRLQGGKGQETGGAGRLSLAPRPTPHALGLEYIFEPSAQRVFEELLPRWVLATFQGVMLEAFTSEHSARMIAMKNATDNAEELLETLTMQRNKVRQASITKELSEIVGTVESLK